MGNSADNKAIALKLLQQGIKYHRTNQIEGALSFYRRSVDLDPDLFDAYLNIGAALHDLGAYEEALTVYDKAIEVRPDWGELLYNKGNTLMALDRYDQAMECYRHCIDILPDHVEAFVTMGTALESLGKYDEALPYYDLALSRKPDCAEAHWNRALSLLRKGEFLEGWREFEWRWKKKGYTTIQRTWDCPQWDGRMLHGETVLIHAEQAFGDTLQFIRYLPYVAARGAKVVVECPEPLKALVSGVEGVSSVSCTASTLLPYDYQVPLLSLPFLFGTTLDSIPSIVPYLKPPSDRLNYWKCRVIQDSTFKVGLVWAGRKTPDPHRTCGFKVLGLLAAIKGVTYYSLQLENEELASKELPIGMRCVDLTRGIRDFADSAAIIECLDLVITIDTATAHLAGAMGKTTFVLLPFASDWRWMIGREDSPWYPTMRVFRQKKPLDWWNVVYEVKYALLEKISNR